MIDPLSLTQALCTRICHDLAGPIGAVSAGVELVGGDPAQVDAETLQLIAGSSAAAAQKLKFLRIALGTPGGALSLSDLKVIAGGYLASIAGPSGAAALAWPPDSAFAAVGGPASLAPVLANMVIMAVEVVPRVRAVTVAAQKSRLTVEALGEISERLDPRRDLMTLLADPDAVALTPKTVQALYAVSLVTQGGGRLSVAAIDGGCRIELNYERA
jgi:histidine phosphotransferase ChpT